MMPRALKFHVLFACLVTLLIGKSVQAAVHTVQVGVDGFSFVSADLTIIQGDTVDWVWVGGSHTVTSGTCPTCPNNGVEFDSGPLLFPTTFSHTFTTTGDFPYYCVPHRLFGMTGTIRVTDALVPSMGLWAGLATALLMAGVGIWWAVPRSAHHPPTV